MKYYEFSPVEDITTICLLSDEPLTKVSKDAIVTISETILDGIIYGLGQFRKIDEIDGDKIYFNISENDLISIVDRISILRNKKELESNNALENAKVRTMETAIKRNESMRYDCYPVGRCLVEEYANPDGTYSTKRLENYYAEDFNVIDRFKVASDTQNEFKLVRVRPV